jgi:hypothetical protein
MTVIAVNTMPAAMGRCWRQRTIDATMKRPFGVARRGPENAIALT